MRAPEDEPLLPAPTPPVPQPQGDPATLRDYARTYLQMAWWTNTLREDIIISGRWILNGMSFDGVRDYVHRKILNLVSEIGLHNRGYTIAAHACQQYAQRLDALKTGNAELDRQSGAFNQALTVLISKIGSGEITPELQIEINQLRTRRRNLMEAVSAAESLEQQAADSAAKNFLAAKVMNSEDLAVLRRAADPSLSADQRRNLLMQAFGAVLLPGMTQEQINAQFRQLMGRNGMQAVFDGVVGEYESTLGRAATGAIVRGGVRIAADALGVIFAVALDLALFPDNLADGDIDDTLTGMAPLSLELAKQKYYDADGNEITLPYVDESPVPAAGGAALPPNYPCDTPHPGDTWGGPGAWRDVNRGDYQALWKRYQEQVTGVAVGHEYSHNGVDYDGFQKVDGQNVYIEAKSRFYSGALKGATLEDGEVTLPAPDASGKPSMAEKTMQRLFDQIQRQTDAIKDDPHAKLRYVMAEDDALEKVKAYAKENLPKSQFDKIEWEHQDNDFAFDGC